MTTFLPRTAWTTTRATAANLVRPVGYAVHWPGSSQKWTGLTQAQVASRLEGIRRYHVSGVYNDIAYQDAIDQAGRVWELRGHGRQSGANGTADLNRAWGALLLLLGPGEEPTPAMHAAVRAWRARWLTTFPGAEREVGHGSIRPGGSECPGPAARGHISRGTWRHVTTATPKPQPAQPKPAPEDDDMPTADEIARAVWGFKNERFSPRDHASLLRSAANSGLTDQQIARVASAAAAAARPDIDVNALARAIVVELGK